MSWFRLNRWWLLALPFALAGTVAATAYNVKVFWYDSGLHHRLALAERGAFVEVTDEYDDAHGATSRTLRVRFGATGTSPTYPTVEGDRVPPTGLEATYVKLDFQADPGETLNFCSVTVEDEQGRRYDVPDRASQASACLPDGQGGPSLALTEDTERGHVPEGEDRPEAWSVAPVFLLPEDAEVARVLVWWENPDYVELPAP